MIKGKLLQTAKSEASNEQMYRQTINEIHSMAYSTAWVCSVFVTSSLLDTHTCCLMMNCSTPWTIQHIFPSWHIQLSHRMCMRLCVRSCWQRKHVLLITGQHNYRESGESGNILEMELYAPCAGITHRECYKWCYLILTKWLSIKMLVSHNNLVT